MEQEELVDKIARLESIQDQLETELAYIDNLLRSVGFSHGLESIKGVALELLANPDLQVDE